jgi:adenosylcobinamide kinase/adenosylcobinamide-phosphate guanylyltransferase
MGKITFILGGSRSGKSNYAIKLAKDAGGRTAFIATCQPLDSEMKKRIAGHKKNRPRRWKTIEEALNPAVWLKTSAKDFDTVIIDCLTLMVSNLMLRGFGEGIIEGKVKATLAALKKLGCRSIIVSNEVGLGIVPQNKLARDYRDIAGRVNQKVAEKSDEVFFMVSGIPWRIK